jgi:iron complex outermembrane receptor protein
MKKSCYFLSTCLSLGVSLMPAKSLAQDASADANSGELQEIVVTAQKRSENLQKVPIAVAAIDSQRLLQAGVQSAQGLAAALPGLQLLNIAGNTTPRVRGVGSGFTAAGYESPVATYVDGVYRGYGADANLDMSDVTQVSLIKGPQGTLFGRNATGGVLQITTREPEQEFSGSFRVGLDNYLTLRGDSFVTGGLSDTVAASLALSYTHQGRGWGENLFTGNDTYKIKRSFSARGKVKADLGDSTDVTIAADYTSRAGPIATNFHVFPGLGAAFMTSPAPARKWDVNNSSDTFNRFSGGGGSLTFNHDLGFAKFSSITAYRDAHNPFGFTAVPVPTAIFDAIIEEKSRQFTQELQLSNTNGPLVWTIGAYYFYNKATQTQRSIFHPVLGLPFSEQDFPTAVTADSYAAFAQGTYTILPTTRFTAGFRYTWQTTRFAGSEILVFPTGPLTLFTVPTGERSNFKKPTWRLSLDHDLAEDITGYISYNRGVKSGGYNLRSPRTGAYQPEQLDAYEIGLKSLLDARRIRLNLAGFYYKYKNIQVPKFVNGTAEIDNGAAATIYGIDADFEARLTSQFSLNGGATWLHTKFDAFPESSTSVLLPGNIPGPAIPFDASGNAIPMSPRFTYVIGATYTVPTGSGDVAFNVNDSYNSGFYGEADNVLRQKAYHFVNASVTWTSENKAFVARLYANNIFNKAAASQFVTIAGLAYVADYTNPPRIIGGSFQFNF